jgi:hypothetical protein
VSVAACVSLGGLDPRTTRQLLHELSKVALLLEHDAGHYRSHVLVKAFARELCAETETEAERTEATSRLLQHYLLSSVNAGSRLAPSETSGIPPALPGVRPEAPASYDEAMAWFGAEREVLRDAVLRSAAVGFGIAPWQLVLGTEQYLRRTGFLVQWLEVARISLDAARRTGDRLGVAHMLRSAAGAQYCIGSYEQARGLLVEARDIFAELGRERELGQTVEALTGVGDPDHSAEDSRTSGGRAASSR